MASYTIRVELNSPTPDAQSELLYIMLEHGFSRCVVCEKGKTFVLPSNEFVYVGYENLRTLTDRVATLIDSFSPNPLVLVTQSAERCWSGLNGVKLA
ncbi:hypothetical protein PRCB_24330 [Pantoea rodasii]|uniref:DUF2622 domain-containing protein n=1 Tax=Pantoea rodasii TaxID=1076549 RepID=A0A2M9W6M0_9GAMM|nr:hypothetical protein [Pantoea rodasii]PJZ03190.1 hypothetical protein PRCB_24330 [Pantoea rodasii]